MSGNDAAIQEKCGSVTKSITDFRNTLPVKQLALTAQMRREVELVHEDVEGIPSKVIMAMQTLKISDLQLIVKLVDRIKELLNKSSLNVEGKYLMEKSREIIGQLPLQE